MQRRFWQWSGVAVLVVAGLGGVGVAQSSSTSSSSTARPAKGQKPAAGPREASEIPGQDPNQAAAPEPSTSNPHPLRIAQPEAGGAAITLETSEPLFDVAVALNACGYDRDLANSSPIRLEVRDEVSKAIAASDEAKASHTALCQYIADHELSNKARELAQYVSLALYLSPPPDLQPTADEIDMPPDALQVVNIAPLLKTFVEKVGLVGIWQRHRLEYTAVSDKVHDPVTKMILDTNIYLRLPVSSYDGRRFMVLVEPMLAPNEPNARIYATDYVVVTSPTAAGTVKLDDIRHTYLHYEIEPLVYAKATSMERLLPLLKPEQEAPVEFVYKSNVVALVTECMIKAIEARTMDVGEAKPVRPAGPKGRIDAAFDEQTQSYERRAEQARQNQVTLDMRQGWILAAYFYDKLGSMERDSVSLKEDIGEMVYGMDVGRERHRAEQIAFLPTSGGELVSRAPRVPTGLMLAEKKMLEGDVDGAKAIADKALADPKQDHAEANYVLARVQLMQGLPEESMATFEQVLGSSKNPRTLAWAHVYLGRLYDTQPDRPKAVKEYRTAIATLEGQPVSQDAKIAAEQGLKAPFVLPKTVHEEEEPVDPSGKAEKEQYEKEHPELTQPAPKVTPH
jgi:tetratricopeptide (TPR) repeat protein